MVEKIRIVSVRYSRWTEEDRTKGNAETRDFVSKAPWWKRQKRTSVAFRFNVINGEPNPRRKTNTHLSDGRLNDQHIGPNERTIRQSTDMQHVWKCL